MYSISFRVGPSLRDRGKKRVFLLSWLVGVKSSPLWRSLLHVALTVQMLAFPFSLCGVSCGSCANRPPTSPAAHFLDTGGQFTHFDPPLSPLPLEYTHSFCLG